MPGRDTVPFSTEAMKASLLRLQNEWETVQASRDRDAIYQYLTAVFELVYVVGEGGQGSQACSSGVAPAWAQLGKRARTVCRSDPLYVRSRKGR